MRRSLLLGLSLVVACSADATPKNKPVSAPVVEEKKSVVRPQPLEELAPPMTAAPTFSAVVAGSQQSCGITESADLYCWGRNDLGQLGDGGSAERTLPAEIGRAHV